ncbi:acyl carrier protein [Sphingomonas edaphi]|uniref:Acyl carrier protein n=1 Tax=Sphingomonas edaphi TaxID=2315689 RepID=A0A418Q1N2_9SPHN|nr:acyl carrier protein [Sphingomonas edaphi]RIX31942.1 acyl carrier protein [Sphingomonas edaphi]
MANSLDLDPEWGAIDLLEEVEATFGIKIANEEAEQCATVGGLYDVVCSHSPDWNGQDGSCGSSMVFYRMRRSLSPDDKRGITPDTALAASGMQPSRMFKKLADETGLRLPSYELTWLGMMGGGLLVGGIIAAIVALLTGHWIVSSIFGLIALAGLPLLRLDPGRFPAGFVTVADLVRRTVPLNSNSLRDAGGRPADRWSVLAALAAEHGTLPPDQIGPDTFLHRRSLEEALKQA